MVVVPPSNVTVQDEFSSTEVEVFKELPEVQHRYAPSLVLKANDPSAEPATTSSTKVAAGLSV